MIARRCLWALVGVVTVINFGWLVATASTKQRVVEPEWGRKIQLVSTLLYKEAELGRFDLRGLKRQLVELERIPRDKQPSFHRDFYDRTLNNFRYQRIAYNGKVREYEEARSRLVAAFPQIRPVGLSASD